MYINGHFLGALECRSGGGFHALAGCVAYFCTRAVRKRGETPHQRCYNAPYLGASKCPYKSGFASGSGCVAYANFPTLQ